jgi:hypothetical protein
MYAYHAIFNLADGTAMLSLHAGGFIAFFDEAGLVNHTDAVRLGVMSSDMLLKTISQTLFLPVEQTEKLLQIAGRFTAGVGHWLYAFSFQVAQLAFDIHVQVPSAADATEAVVKLVQKTGQFGFDPQNSVGVHA